MGEVCFSRQGFSVQPWLSWNSICRQGWPWTQRSTCLCVRVLGLKTCTTTARLDCWLNLPKTINRQTNHETLLSAFSFRGVQLKQLPCSGERLEQCPPARQALCSWVKPTASNPRGLHLIVCPGHQEITTKLNLIFFGFWLLNYRNITLRYYYIVPYTLTVSMNTYTLVSVHFKCFLMIANSMCSWFSSISVQTAY